MWLVWAIGLIAQGPVQTILPTTQVVQGEPFRIQYVVKYSSTIENFSPPDFRKFRIITGPEIYTSREDIHATKQHTCNYIFTLEARSPGQYLLPPVRVMVDGKPAMSETGVLRVLSKEEASEQATRDMGGSSDYFLRPGENVNEKIRQNLFLKLMVDKTTCYVGEPVLATFKLYSRLESRSDIVKNPGFYGFSVFDMINLSDRLVTTETINGKSFDVHTIRKVQLFPIQAGTFVIDPMAIKNEIEFSRSSVNKKTEQEIVEGTLNTSPETASAANTTVVENELSTNPVTITVKPVPATRPAGFAGAVGHFTIAGSLGASHFSKNEEGFIDITINGQGNFIQLNPPVMNWPAGIEGFEPVTKDSFDKNLSPISGKRVFHYAFIAATPGTYTIPPVSITYFNPDSGRYATASTPEQVVTVSAEEKAPGALPPASKAIIPSNKKWAWISGLLALLVAGVVVGFVLRQKKMRKNIVVSPTPIPAPEKPGVETLLTSSRMNLHADSREFYDSLYQ